MSSNEKLNEAGQVLQQLGLKEYEAKCFVGLTQLPSGTARQLSEITDVPQTRVYDAIRVLEARGLVEIQHSSPQQFRAVSLDEAMETMRDRYEDRIHQLRGKLEQVDQVQVDDDEPVQEVWTMTGRDAIRNRLNQLLDEAREEVVLIIGHEDLLTAELVEHLNEIGQEVDLLIGTVSKPLRERLRNEVPAAQSFISGLEWLSTQQADDDLLVGQMLMVDQSNLLVSTYNSAAQDEHAVVGGGSRNGLIVVARQLLAQGLLQKRDPQ